MAWPLTVLVSFAFAQTPSPWEALPRLAGKDAAGRQAACRELGSMGRRASCAIGPLIERLDDPALDVRIAAAEALGSIGHFAVHDLLHADSHWRDSDAPSSDDALRGLDFGAGLPAPPTFAGWGTTHFHPPNRPSLEVRLALRRVGKPCGPALLAVLQSSRASVAARRRAMHELYVANCRDPDFVPTLIDLLTHDELKDHAAAALASLGTEIADGLPALVRHLNEDPSSAQSLVEMFTNSGTQAPREEAMLLLAQALPTVKLLEVRAEIAKVLAGSTDPRVRRQLVPLLKSRETALVAAPALLEEPGKVGKRAHDLLVKAIRRKDQTDEYSLPAIAAVKWVSGTDKRARDSALRESVRYHSWTPAAWDALGKVLADGDADAKRRALTLMWRSGFPVWRSGFPDGRMEPTLRKLLTGPDLELRDAAAEALVGWDVVDDALREPMMAGLLRKWRGLHAFPDFAGWPRRLAPVAMGQSESEDFEVARAALTTMHALGPAAAPMVPRLVALRKKPELRDMVDWALEGIVDETFEDQCRRQRSAMRSRYADGSRALATVATLLPIRARELTAALTARPPENDEEGEYTVADALAAIGSPEAIAAIIKRAGDATLDENVRMHAVLKLPSLGTAGLPAADAVRSVFEERPLWAVWVSAGIGADIPDALLERAARPVDAADMGIPAGEFGHIGPLPPAVPKLLRHDWLPITNMVDAALGDRGPAAAAMLVPVLRELLTGESDDLRIQALYAVNRLHAGTEPLLGELIACLESREPLVVAGATYALARLGSAAAAAVPRLRRLLDIGHDPMPTAVALGCIGSSEAITILRRMLDDADADVRTAACRGLWHAGPRAASAVGTLRVLLDDPSCEMFAADALLRLAPGRAVNWVLPVLQRRALPAEDTVSIAVPQLLRACGAAAVPHLVRLLQRRDDDIGHVWRWSTVVQTLGEMGPAAAEALPALRALRSHNWNLRASQAAAIARIQRRVGPCVELMRQALRMPGAPTDELLAAIAECGEAAALADFSWAPDASVRLRATEAMGAMPLATEVTGRHLAARLDDTDPAVRFAAAHAFHRLGPAARPALPALRELEKIADPILQETVREVMRAIERRP